MVNRLEIHDPTFETHVSDISQSLRVCINVWPIVIDEMLVCKLAQYLQSVCSSCAKRIPSLHGMPLSHRECTACSISTCARTVELLQ